MKTILATLILLSLSCSGVFDWKDEVLYTDTVQNFYYKHPIEYLEPDTTVIIGNKYEYYVILIHKVNLGDKITSYDDGGKEYIRLTSWGYKFRLHKRITLGNDSGNSRYIQEENR